MTQKKRVGIAVVEYNGRYLVGIRDQNRVLAGYAEFPGGKCLAAERPEDCAVRECFEESGLIVTPLRLLKHCEFEYPHGKVELFFILCQPANVAEVKDTHQEFAWVETDRLKSFKFPEANQSVIEQLVSPAPTIPHSG